jgi:cell division protein FtsQ
MTVALIAGILWARYKSQGEVCTRVEVEVVNADSTSFVTPTGVLNDLKNRHIKLEGESMDKINASKIEQALRESPYLESADIVKCADGRVLIRVSQLVPVMRVFDGDKSYYVNRAGKPMDANAYYHSDVPVVQGHFTRKYPAIRLLPLIDYVECDTLLRSLVTMYSVQDSNNIIIVREFSGHVVNIGNVQGLENKFAKLKLFYREVMPKRGWNTFDTISVKWNHQIVATRRNKAVVETIIANPDDDEQAPDLETTNVNVTDQSASTQADKQKADEKKADEKKPDEKKPDGKKPDEKKPDAKPDDGKKAAKKS